MPGTYGTNFFNVDALFSNPNEPALNSSGGSTEFYAVYRGQFSPDKIFGVNTHFGPISAINFEIGGDAETENTAFAPNKRLLVVGPNFNFDLGAGFLNIGVHFSKEWNHNGFCADACAKPGGPVSFSPAPEAEFVWLYNLKGLTGLPLDLHRLHEHRRSEGQGRLRQPDLHRNPRHAAAEPGCRHA